jgi:hypothetical protein
MYKRMTIALVALTSSDKVTALALKLRGNN